MIQELGNQLIPVLAIGSTLVVLVVWIIAETIDSIYKTSCNSRLKEKLVDRGISASEIDRIIKAGMDEIQESEFVQPVPPVKNRDPYQVSGRVG